MTGSNKAESWTDGVTIVAGNGASLAAIAPGCVLARDRMLRTNNFFFEDRFYLGTRVDLALVGGDPRVAPFVCETLSRATAQYQVAAWSASTARVARIGQRFLAMPHWPHRLSADVDRVISSLCARYQAQLSTGIQGLLLAHALGARRVILAGVDLYAGPQRYAYQPRRHQLDLMGSDLATRAYDLRLHHPDLDREVISWVAEQPGMSLWRAADIPALNGLLDLAPKRSGPGPENGPKPQILDWANWAGWYPIALLKLLRRLRRWQRQLTGSVS